MQNNIAFYKPDVDTIGQTIFDTVNESSPINSVVTIRTGIHGLTLLLKGISPVEYKYESEFIKVVEIKNHTFTIVIDNQLIKDDKTMSPLGGNSLEYSIIVESGVNSVFFLPLEFKEIEQLDEEEKKWFIKHKLIDE